MRPVTRIAWFRRLALVGALLAALVVILGAWVRLTDAGLGCPDWPGCYGHLYPQLQQGFAKAMHEMIHRYFASTLGLIIVALLGLAAVNRRIPGQPLVPVAFLFVLVCLQGALGALTVTQLLKPLIVTSHLLGGLSTMAILWWLALAPMPRGPSVREQQLRVWVLVGFAALALQIFLGGWTSTNYAAVACPDLPTCQRSWWPPMDFKDAFVLWRGLDLDYTGGVLSNPARTAIHLTHRVGAILAGVILTAVAVLCIANARGRPRVLGFLLVAAVLLQISIGLTMVHLGMPLGAATAHNAGAALLVIVMTALLRSLWQGPRAGVVT